MYNCYITIIFVGIYKSLIYYSDLVLVMRELCSLVIHNFLGNPVLNCIVIDIIDGIHFVSTNFIELE